MQLLKHNWHWKLLSLVLAIILNVFVRTRKEETLVNAVLLPLGVTAPPGQRVAEPSPDFRVRVDLEGPAELVRSMIENDDLRLEFDESRLEAGKRVPVPIQIEYPDRYKGRVTVDWRPRVVHVKLVSDATRQLPIVVKPLNRLPGWEFRELPTARPDQVTVSGPEPAVSKVATVEAPFTVDENPRVSVPVALRALDSSQNDITDQVRLRPAQVMVTGMQDPVVIQKRVPVQPAFQIPPGTRVRSLEVVPSHVRIVGPQRTLASIYVLNTDPIPIPSGATKVQHEAVVEAAGANVEVTPSKVTVHIQLVPIEAPAPPPPAKPDREPQ